MKLKNIKTISQLYDQIDFHVKDLVSNHKYQINDQIYDQVNYLVRSQIYNQVWDSVNDLVGFRFVNWFRFGFVSKKF